MQLNQISPLSPSPTPSFPSETPTGSRTTLFTFLGIVSFLVVGLGGVLLGKYLYGYRTEQNASNVTPTPRVEVPTVTPTTNPMVGWKTFVSPDSNFSLKYPSEYELKTLVNLGYVINRNITLPSYPVSITACRGDCPVISSSEEVTLQIGVKAIKVKGYIGSIGGNIPESFIRYEMLNPHTVPERRYTNIILWELPQDINYQDKIKQYPPDRGVNPISPEHEHVFDQILSTFKFIESSIDG